MVTLKFLCADSKVTDKLVTGMTVKLTLCHNPQVRQVEKTSCDLDEAMGRTCPDLS